MSQLTEAEFQALRRDSADNIEAYLLDADGLDAVFFLHSLAFYVAARLALNFLVGGRLEAGMTATARQFSKCPSCWSSNLGLPEMRLIPPSCPPFKPVRASTGNSTSCCSHRRGSSCHFARLAGCTACCHRN